MKTFIKFCLASLLALMCFGTSAAFAAYTKYDFSVVNNATGAPSYLLPFRYWQIDPDDSGAVYCTPGDIQKVSVGIGYTLKFSCFVDKPTESGALINLNYSDTTQDFRMATRLQPFPNYAVSPKVNNLQIVWSGGRAIVVPQ